MAHPTWRGVTICPCLKEPLDELARSSGRDILVSPIKGFGSYQVGKTASAGTGSGGGHVDLGLGRLNAQQKLRLEGLARQIGFYADIREPTWWSPTRKRWLRAKWASHLHMILKDCRHLSPEAKAQLREWYAGENGLAGDDPDDGDRTYLRQTWKQYRASKHGIKPPPPQPTISVANLKHGRRNGDVKRYQAVVWKRLAAATRTKILTRNRLKESQIADGFYGDVTVEMTKALYAQIAAKEPKGGWPIWAEPGPRLLKRLGFIPMGTRDLDDPHDEFGEPDSVSDPVSASIDPHPAGVVQ